MTGVCGILNPRLKTAVAPFSFGSTAVAPERGGSPKKDEPVTRTGMSARLHNAFCSGAHAARVSRLAVSHISLGVGARMPRTGCRVGPPPSVKGSVATEVQCGQLTGSGILDRRSCIASWTLPDRSSIANAASPAKSLSDLAIFSTTMSYLPSLL